VARYDKRVGPGLTGLQCGVRHRREAPPSAPRSSSRCAENVNTFLLALETAQREHIQLTFSDFSWLIWTARFTFPYFDLTRSPLFSDVIAVTNLVVFVLNKKMFISLIGSVEKAKGERVSDRSDLLVGYYVAFK
jgi:hypothetical protein